MGVPQLLLASEKKRISSVPTFSWKCLLFPLTLHLHFLRIPTPTSFALSTHSLRLETSHGNSAKGQTYPFTTEIAATLLKLGPNLHFPAINSYSSTCAYLIIQLVNHTILRDLKPTANLACSASSGPRPFPFLVRRFIRHSESRFQRVNIYYNGRT